MKEPYCKLACSFPLSSLNSENDATFRIWVIILCMKDKDGIVHSSVDGVAQMSRKTVEQVEIALAKFMAPDPHSKNPDNEGRRIERVAGGFKILNHEYYRNIFSLEETREYERVRKAEQRARRKSVPDSPGQNGTVPNVPQSDQIKSDQIKSGGIPIGKQRWQITKEIKAVETRLSEIYAAHGVYRNDARRLVGMDKLPASVRATVDKLRADRTALKTQFDNAKE